MHWAMAALKAQWAALHVLPPNGRYTSKPTLLVATPAPAEPGNTGGAVFDFLSDEILEAVATLAARTVNLGHALTVASGRGAQRQANLPCAALCVPLLDSDRRTSVGTLTICSGDAARAWTADEQGVLATAAPLFGLHMMRERLAAQAELLSGAAASGSDAGAAGKELTDHAARVVQEMRSVHANKLKEQQTAHQEKERQLLADHQMEKQELEAALAEARQRVEEVERASAVRMHKMMEGLELQHIAELDALREDLKGEKGTTRTSTPKKPPRTPVRDDGGEPQQVMSAPPVDEERLLNRLSEMLDEKFRENLGQGSHLEASLVMSSGAAAAAATDASMELFVEREMAATRVQNKARERAAKMELRERRRARAEGIAAAEERAAAERAAAERAAAEIAAAQHKPVAIARPTSATLPATGGGAVAAARPMGAAKPPNSMTSPRSMLPVSKPPRVAPAAARSSLSSR